MASSPTETLTFLYTDIQGSTRLWQQHPDAMSEVIARHDALLKEVVETHGGTVFRTMGDAVCAAFPTALDALAAARDGQRAIQAEPWRDDIELRVRMAMHTGAAELRDGDYVGHTLNRVARLVAAGHGGQVLLSDVTQALLLDSMPSDVRLRDLGEHRVKDLERMEHIYQVEAPDVPANFPPLRTLDSVPTNLPVQPTPFIGREAEVDAVEEMLARPEVRLLTLLGPGGTGKTRLALRVGARLLDRYHDGVFFVPLAPVGDPLRVASSVASVLGIQESPEAPVDERLVAYLRDRETLLILDNFEQVVDAAPLVGRLLTAAPRLTVLVTSRSILHLAAEHEYAVPTLAVPDPAQPTDVQTLMQYDAVKLFIQRAQAIKPDFSVTDVNAPAVAEICYRLDGLPLAIELAAARTRLFPPEALLKRLGSRLSVLTGGARDLPARQQTLRGAIDWSYSLLSPDEQRLFARLAVFSGGWTLEAAEGVCAVEGDLDVLSGLEALVEQSLVRQDGSDEPRFMMLETIREYASERLRASPEIDEVHRRHAEWYLEPIRHSPLLMTDITSMMKLWPFFRSEQDNLRAALRWCLEAQEWPTFARLLSPIGAFWFTQGQWSEALSWTEAVLPLLPPTRTWERSVVLFLAGFFLHRQAQYEAASERLKESIEILRELGRKGELSAALYALGESLSVRGQREEARPVLEEALEVSREINHTNMPMILTYLGILAREEGDYAGARARLDEALAVAGSFGSVSFQSVALNSLGDLARLEGDYERAGKLYDQLMSMALRNVARFTHPGQLHNQAYVAHHFGDDTKARRQFNEAITLYREMGDPRGVAECVAGLAVLEAESNPVKATRLLAAAMTTVESMGSRLSSSNQREYDRALAAIHAELDEADFQAAWDEGRATSLDEAVACATGGTHWA